jgi:hypothetical protein
MIKKTIQILFVLIMICVTIQTARSADYYIATNGNDSNPGTESKPWKTIQKGANVAVAGDTIFVRGGVYYEWVDIKHSGSNGKPITFKAYPGEKPIIDGTGVSVSSWKALIWSTGNDYIVIDGFEVRNTQSLLIRLDQGNHLSIRNCVVHGNSGSGGSDNNHSGIFIGYYCDYVLVERCESYDTGHDAFNVESSSHVTFQYNYAHDNPNHAAYNLFPINEENPQKLMVGNSIKYCISARSMCGVYTRYQKDFEVSNNLIYDSYGGGIYMIDSRDDHMAPSYNYQSNNKIVNNVITGCVTKYTYTYAIANFNAQNSIIQNNIVFNNKNHNEIYVESGAAKGTVVSNNLLTDPKFVNASSHDYHLQAGSPAIDKGANLSSIGITDDLDGNARPSGAGYDIGAYEYNNR